MKPCASFGYSWASLCCLLWCFRTVRAQQTVSRIRSVLKRTITARGRPSLSVFGPSRCDLSMSAKASGGVKHMVSLITNSTLSSVVPSPCSQIPWIRTLGRRVYCSWLSESISRFASIFSSPSILPSLIFNCVVK